VQVTRPGQPSDALLKLWERDMALGIDPFAPPEDAEDVLGHIHVRPTFAPPDWSGES
jgi:hypothetical protein